MKYTIPQAITKITSAAKAYERELADRNLLVIFGSKDKPQFIQLNFLKQNFLHLTGVVPLIKGKDAAKLFYDKAIGSHLGNKDFTFRDDNTTEIKLDIIHQAMNIAHTANQVGDYNRARPKLIADRISGTNLWSLAFMDFGNDYLRPCSLLNDDVRNNVDKSQKILAIFRKGRNVFEYSEITRVGKDIDISRLAVTIDKLYPKLLARTLYGVEKNPNMTNPASDPYIAVEYKLGDGVCTKSAELFIGTKADCDRKIQSYSEDKPPPKIELYQITDPESEQSKQLIEAVSAGTAEPTEDMCTKTYEYSFTKSDDKDWCTKKLQEAYRQFTTDFQGRKLSTGDVIAIDNHPFVFNGEKLHRVPSFFISREHLKSLEATEKKLFDDKDKTTEKTKHKPQKHRR